MMNDLNEALTSFFQFLLRWDTLIFVIIIYQVTVFLLMVFFNIRKKNLVRDFKYIFLVYLSNLIMYSLPLLHKCFESKVTFSMYDLVDRIVASLLLFFGNTNSYFITDFSKDYPFFTLAYNFAIIGSIAAIVSATITIFKNYIINMFRIRKLLSKDSCDIMVGINDKSLEYSKNKDTIFLVDKNIERERIDILMSEGYTILFETFSLEFLNCKYMKKCKRYNIICTDCDNEVFEYIDIFDQYMTMNTSKSNKQGENDDQSTTKKKFDNNIYLFLEVKRENTTIIDKELVDKSKNNCVSYITTFSCDELMARDFVQKNPISKFIPRDFIDKDTSLKNGTKINVVFWGFEPLLKELYYQSILNNQFVTYKEECGEYRTYPISYIFYSEKANEEELVTNYLNENLEEIRNNQEEYYPAPDIPAITQIQTESEFSRKTLNDTKQIIRDDNAYTFVVIDTGNIYSNLELSNRLYNELDEDQNYKVFINSNNITLKGHNQIQTFGNLEQILNREVIVNDNLSIFAIKLNEEYYKSKNCGNKTESEIEEQAKTEWRNMRSFLKYSNIYSAVNLRVKLNLLGYDYYLPADGEKMSMEDHGYHLLTQIYGKPRKTNYKDYFDKTMKNALIAQEHTRWVAFHLLNGFLPLEKSKVIVEKEKQDESKINIKIKNEDKQKHACITTFLGLNELSKDLTDKVNELKEIKNEKIEDHDYYRYDESIMKITESLLTELGYWIVKLEEEK